MERGGGGRGERDVRVEGEGERRAGLWREVEGREMWGGRGGSDHQVGGEARRQHGCGPLSRYGESNPTYYL